MISFVEIWRCRGTTQEWNDQEWPPREKPLFFSFLFCVFFISWSLHVGVFRLWDGTRIVKTRREQTRPPQDMTRQSPSYTDLSPLSRSRWWKKRGRAIAKHWSKNTKLKRKRRLSFVLCRLVLSCLVMSCLVMSCIVLSRLISIKSAGRAEGTPNHNLRPR